MTTAGLLDRLRAVECPAFAHRRETRTGGEAGPSPILLRSATDVEIEDTDGRRYLDFVAGFGALVLGHGHPGWRARLDPQLDAMVQGMGDVYASETKLRLLERLSRFHPEPGAQVLLTQSGSDAVTAALKTAALSTGRPGVVAFEGAYHGLGHGPLAACGYRPSFRLPFADQLGAHVTFAPFPRHEEEVASALQQLERALEREDVGAVLLEPILGRGGVVLPPAGFLAAVKARARRRGARLIADEVWTGMGRCGAWTRLSDENVAPDILCLGKGLGGGLSVSACIAPAAIMKGWTEHGEVVHTSTHVGQPLVCASALATLDILAEEKLVERAARDGQWALALLRERLPSYPVRGAGFMIGVELADAATAQRVMAAAQREGFLLLSGGDGSVLTLTPPLTMPRRGWERLAAFLGEALS